MPNTAGLTQKQRMNFRVRVHEFREEFGLTQVDLARELGVAIRTVRNMECGHWGPSPAVLAKFKGLERRMRE